jgi:hypothetical protein
MAMASANGNFASHVKMVALEKITSATAPKKRK